MEANKDWFPFFSMLFWCATKIAGMVLFLFGLNVLVMSFGSGGGFSEGWFWRLVFMIAMPMVIGLVVLKSDLLYDWATEAQRQKRPAGS